MGKRMVFRRPTQVGFMVTYPSRENTSHAFLVDIHMYKELQSGTKKGIASVDRCKRNIFIYLFIWPILKQCT